MTEVKPQNGVAGLKHWRSDMLAGLLVSLVSLPFSLGIAIASGAPPVAGLVSAIIAGLIYPFLGGSFVTISGPAAGLAPVLFVAMTALGRGDREVGYPLLLCVIGMAGCVQIILSRLKVARFSAWFSPTVVEGMLAAIGLLIIAKEFPELIGNKFESHEFWGIIAEIPRQLMQMDPRVALIGVVCLGLTVALSAAKARWTKVVPPPLTVVLVGLVLAQLVRLDPTHMLHIPDNLLKDSMKFPHFAGLFADRSLWWLVFTTVLTLTLIDGVESLATIAGIDKIDPWKRKSSPDRTLLAMGVSNILSSVAGGLTIIPGGVKSTTCIVTGGKTLWANFYNAIFLLMYLFLGKQIINLIPLSALAAIVVFIGYKLCRPRVWRHVAHVGSEQLLVFCTTVIVTVSTDLLLGIISGMALELVLNVSFAWPAARLATGASPASGNGVARTLARFADLFRNPVTHRELVDNQFHVYFGRPLVSFNTLHLNRELARIPDQATTVYFHVGDDVTLIDHTSSTNLMSFAHDYEQSGKGQVQFTGLDEMSMCSGHETCLRVGRRALAGPSRGGLGVLLDKASRSWRSQGSPGTCPAPIDRAGTAPPRFTRHGDDMGWLSLSCGDGNHGSHVEDVSCLGPRPTDHVDGRSELGRLSLSWDALPGGVSPTAEPPQ
ncbi:MAG: SulP family inorganic anion transporter, partial [Deltaproteobacteria bacterium]